MTDYWLNKIFFELQRPDRARRYKQDRAGVLTEYRLPPALRAALLADDVAGLAPHANPYLLRYFFAAIGMSDAEFIARLNQRSDAGAEHG